MAYEGGNSTKGWVNKGSSNLQRVRFIQGERKKEQAQNLWKCSHQRQGGFPPSRGREAAFATSLLLEQRKRRTQTLARNTQFELKVGVALFSSFRSCEVLPFDPGSRPEAAENGLSPPSGFEWRRNPATERSWCKTEPQSSRQLATGAYECSPPPREVPGELKKSNKWKVSAEGDVRVSLQF